MSVLGLMGGGWRPNSLFSWSHRAPGISPKKQTWPRTVEVDPLHGLWARNMSKLI